MLWEFTFKRSYPMLFQLRTNISPHLKGFRVRLNPKYGTFGWLYEVYMFSNDSWCNILAKFFMRNITARRFKFSFQPLHKRISQPVSNLVSNLFLVILILRCTLWNSIIELLTWWWFCRAGCSGLLRFQFLRRHFCF